MSDFRSKLYSSEKEPTVRSARELGESAGEPRPRVLSEPSRGDLDSTGPRIDSLELALAVAGPAIRALSPDGLPLEPRSGFAATTSIIEPAVVEQMVRRLVIGGDRRRGVARIELDGDYAGTTIWVREEGSELELEVVVAPGLPSHGLPERLLGRLRASGLDVRLLEVR